MHEDLLMKPGLADMTRIIWAQKLPAGACTINEAGERVPRAC